MKILIADDDPIPRRLLEASLVKAGYEVLAARDGAEAWQILQSAEAPRLAILDWLMPGMDGVEICRMVRQRQQGPYLYLILLTSKISKEDVVAGMEAGADDYLTKPFDPHELQVRVRAGQRILDLETALVASRDALAKARQREVEIGARIQQTLLLGRPPHESGTAQVTALTIPSQQIDGDFYDFFSFRNGCLDVVVGDVMGKGVPAALLGAAVKSHFLRALSHLIALSTEGKLPEPEEIVAQVHREVTGEFIGLEFFVTLCYARFDPERHQMLFVDCGHTKTIHYRASTATSELLEGENIPLGVSETETYTQSAASFEADDLFCFYSDGVTEARSPAGEFFGVERLIALIQDQAQTASQDLMDRIRQALVDFTGAADFADDLTCVIVKASNQTSPDPSFVRREEPISSSEGGNELSTPSASEGKAGDIAPSPYEGEGRGGVALSPSAIEESRAGGGAETLNLHDSWETTSDLRELAGLRERVRAFCRQLRDPACDEESIIQLELAVNEVASNIMRHAYEGRTDQPIRVEMEASEDAISLKFYHYGISFDPETASPPAFDGSRQGGFGVYMIAQCVDELHYSHDEHGKNTVSLLKYRKARMKDEG